MHGDQGIFGIAVAETGYRVYTLPAPVRLLDTRVGQPACVTPGAQMTANTPNLQKANTICTGVPSNARAIIGNITVVAPSANGFITLYPADKAKPTASSQNFNTLLVANNVKFFVGLSPQGEFYVYPSQTVDVVIDIDSYLA